MSLSSVPHLPDLEKIGKDTMIANMQISRYNQKVLIPTCHNFIDLISILDRGFTSKGSIVITLVYLVIDLPLRVLSLDIYENAH